MMHLRRNRRAFAKRLSERGGFTLIETFVAITILLTAIAGPLTIASKGLSSSLLARDQITAFFLAQDAIEYIRSVRDGNALAEESWLTGLDLCMNDYCAVDSKEDSIESCPGGVCPALRYDESTGFFGYSLIHPASTFTRTVTLSTVDGKEVSINVTISWKTGIFTRSLTVRENMLDWSSVAATPPPPAPLSGAVEVESVVLTPTTLAQGEALAVSITVYNGTADPLPTQDPAPGYVYQEGQDFRSLGFSESTGSYRFGVDYTGRTGVDHPYRWGFDTPLASGETRTVTGYVELNSSQSQNYWVGLVEEWIEWHEDNLGSVLITVSP